MYVFFYYRGYRKNRIFPFWSFAILKNRIIWIFATGCIELYDFLIYFDNCNYQIDGFSNIFLSFSRLTFNSVDYFFLLFRKLFSLMSVITYSFCFCCLYLGCHSKNNHYVPRPMLRSFFICFLLRVL